MFIANTLHSALAKFAIAATLVSLAFTSQAQSLEIPVGQQGGNTAGLSLPSLGMSQTFVEDNFGAPNATRGPVGDPPITTWVYDGYTVYFEYNIVIHTVLKHRPVN